MKRKLRLSCSLLLLSCFLFTAVPARTAHPAANPELVLSIPLLTDKDYENVKNTLLHTDGIALQGYCPQYKCFLMNYDPSKIKSGQAIAEMVETAYPAYKTEVKVGASIAQLIDGCSKFPQPAPAAGTER